MSWRAKLSRFATATVALALATVVTIVATPLISGADILQGSPSSGTVDVAGSGNFTSALQPESGSYSGAVTYAASGPSTPTGLNVSTSGSISTTGTLSATTYTISGTDSDSPGPDTGIWSYTLIVTNTVVQGPPSSGTVDVASSSNFTDTLAPASGYPGPVTYAANGPSTPAGLNVSTSGLISTTGTLSATTYTISGTDSDNPGPDTGTWTYSLSVTPDQIVQAPPNSGTTTSTNSGNFSTTLQAASGFQGQVTFATAQTGFEITNGNELVSTSTLSVSGSPYTVSGTDSDADGDSGTWTFSLTVLPTGAKTVIVQLTPTSGTTLNTASSTFTAGPITTENNTGPVNFLTTKSNPILTVSTSGLISTTGPLAIGTYTVSGTDSDSAGDSGVWSYTLTVAGAVVSVTFEANGGAGTMAPESASEPTALSLNVFTWLRHTFVDWNTAANGTGVAYANGAVFPFSAPEKLFAQWKAGKSPSRTITFFSNGGKGSTASEIDNTPTAIAANHFERAGYTFVDWNTAANGSGTSYKAGATFPFKKSVTLYAQWKKTPTLGYHLVTFAANGGIRKMAVERDDRPSVLTTNHFQRAGYTFVGWNTVANGSGTSYKAGATFSFKKSVTLYAQWKKDKSVVVPPIQKTALTIGPFAVGSSSVSSGLESLIKNLAELVKTGRHAQIALLGYGDTLSATGERNKSLVAADVELGQKRAQSVATNLQDDLNALGLKGWTISLAAANGTTPLDGRSAAGYVIADLS